MWSYIELITPATCVVQGDGDKALMVMLLVFILLVLQKNYQRINRQYILQVCLYTLDAFIAATLK